MVFTVTSSIIAKSSELLCKGGWRWPRNKSLLKWRDVFRFENTALWISELAPCVAPRFKAVKVIWLKKISIPMNLSSLSFSSTLGDVFMHMYFTSWARSKSFHRKVIQMFSLITGRHIGGPHGFSIQNSIKLRETLWQITQKRCTTQT